MIIQINLTDKEEKILLNDLDDIEKWVQDAVKGKINSCKKRLIKEWIPKLIKDEKVSTLPAEENALMKTIFDREDYKNRVQREQVK